MAHIGTSEQFFTADDLQVDVDGDTATILEPKSGKMLVVNTMGRRILDYAATPTTIETIVAEIAGQTAGVIEPEEIEKDVQAFVDVAIAKNVLIAGE